MALIAKVSPSMDTITGQYANQISGLYAGEALAIADACYIAADGLVYRSDATAADALAECRGFTARAVAIGQPVTLFGAGARFRYAAGLTPGAPLYVGATAGRLDDAATVGDPVTKHPRVAICITATDIMVLR